MARLFSLLIVPATATLLASPAAAIEGNVDAGKKVFARCAVCHGVGETKKPIGPTLNNVVGRTAGTEPEYLAKKGSAGYSPAMIEAGAGGLVWTEENLAKWAADPKGMIPKTKMVFPGLKKEQEVADVVAYIKTFSAQ
jgi:cytochrome c2